MSEFGEIKFFFNILCLNYNLRSEEPGLLCIRDVVQVTPTIQGKFAFGTTIKVKRIAVSA